MTGLPGYGDAASWWSSRHLSPEFEGAPAPLDLNLDCGRADVRIESADLTLHSGTQSFQLSFEDLETIYRSLRAAGLVRPAP